jgi:hypothetical protein
MRDTFAKLPFGRLRRKAQDNIKVDVREMRVSFRMDQTG